MKSIAVLMTLVALFSAYFSIQLRSAFSFSTIMTDIKAALSIDTEIKRGSQVDYVRDLAKKGGFSFFMDEKTYSFTFSIPNENHCAEAAVKGRDHFKTIVINGKTPSDIKSIVAACEAQEPVEIVFINNTPPGYLSPTSFIQPE